MEPTASFLRVMQGLDEGDQKAMTEIYERFIGTMTRWAMERINAEMQSRIDASGVAASAMASFLCNYEKGDYDFYHWGGVMKLLATVTIRKCLNRIRASQTQGRDVGRERGGRGWDAAESVLEPEAEVINRDLVERVLRPFGEKKRAIIVERLEGRSAEEVAPEHEVSKRYVERAFGEFREQFRAYLESIGDSVPGS